MAGEAAVDVSVVVPTRNRRRLLATTLHSVLCQRDVSLQVVVVDDGSTDDTWTYLSGLDDPRLIPIRHELPRGPNAARNAGAKASRGGWVAFVDDDDLWAPDKLARQLRAADDAGAVWVYSGSVNVDDRLRIVHGTPAPDPEAVMAALPHYNAIPASASNVAVRRDIFDAENGFDETLGTCEEWELWLRLARRGVPAWVPAPRVAYRMHPGNAILDVEAVIAGARTIEQRHGVDVDWGRISRWLAQLRLRAGDRSGALRHYARAAAGGQARPVAGDLWDLARRRIVRHTRSRTGRVRRRADQGWEEQARVWVDELREFEDAARGVSQ